MSLLTRQDRTPKFAGQILPARTKSRLIFLNIYFIEIHQKETSSLLKSKQKKKLLCSLFTACLVKEDVRRLDGFYCRCLRQILGILSAFMSLISNKSVYEQAGCPPFSQMLRQRQLILPGKILSSATSNPLRSVSFVGNTVMPTTDQYVRRVGTQFQGRQRRRGCLFLDL